VTTTPMEGIKLAAWGPQGSRKTVVEVGPARLGDEFVVLASLPGSVDASRLVAAARVVKEAGAGILKWDLPIAPLGDGRPATADAERFAALRDVGRRTGLAALVEVTDTREVAAASEVADILMVGAANMQNFSLLKELGRSAKKPVLLMRGWHATLKEWLNSAEYVLLEGNLEVVLCEGGIRSFESGSRAILDLSAVPALKQITHLPVLVDIGAAAERDEVERMSLAAVAAGADGLMIEVAPVPDPAVPPGERKGMSLAAFAALVPKIVAMRSLLEGLGIDHP
jgi:3-deoxy-7-phosphoheptulonate synthase